MPRIDLFSKSLIIHAPFKISFYYMICNFREKRKALVTGPPSHFLFLMCLIIFTISTIQTMAMIKSPKINISVLPQISIIGTIIIASKSIMPIMNNNVITLSPSFHYRSCRFREKEKTERACALSQTSPLIGLSVKLQFCQIFGRYPNF